MNKIKIYLHGALGKKFGKKHSFYVQTPKDAYNALRVNFKGFDDCVRQSGIDGLDYHMYVDGEFVSDPVMFSKVKVEEEIHIAPCIVAHGPLAPVFAAVGKALAATFTFKSIAVATLRFLAVSAIVYGVQTLLFPPPKPPPASQQVSAGANSYFFGGRSNVASQGQVVPVGYGRLKIGSQIVHTSVKNYDLASIKTEEEFNVTVE